MGANAALPAVISNTTWLKRSQNAAGWFSASVGGLDTTFAHDALCNRTSNNCSLYMTNDPGGLFGHSGGLSQAFDGLGLTDALGGQIGGGVDTECPQK
jgi:hypothetical protein